jgi:hypothetical protein
VNATREFSVIYNVFAYWILVLFCSEFADIFDFEHFKNVLADDVRVVSSLPSTHLMTKPVEGSPPLHVTPSWIRARYLRRVRVCQLLASLSLSPKLYLLNKSLT